MSDTIAEVLERVGETLLRRVDWVVCSEECVPTYDTLRNMSEVALAAAACLAEARAGKEADVVAERACSYEVRKRLRVLRYAVSDFLSRWERWDSMECWGGALVRLRAALEDSKEAE